MPKPPGRARASLSPDARSPAQRHLEALAAFSHALQSAGSLAQALELIEAALPGLFDARGAAIYLFDEAHEVPRRACASGRAPSLPPSPEPWLARMRADEPAARRRRGSVWLPLRIEDRVAGLLGLSCPAAEADALLASPFTAVALEQIALEIGNMRSRDALREQSIRDPLTGLFNRRYLEESLQREILRSGRKPGGKARLAVLMIDVDRFKRFNDEHGHEAGDLVLAAIGARLRRLVRGSDIASRHGGEEFVVVMPEVTPARALARAEQIRAAVAAQRLTHGDAPLPTVTVSIGVAVYPQHGETVESLVRAADMALYCAKREGRDRVCSATAEALHDPDYRTAIFGDSARPGRSGEG
ncbi:GGDEF domain-containing protein [Burkholderiaceae bacterium FT117]|uniref:GGDEF domain-containing protein n=1 Tax=Zeimonas sediminis TaxID=2944268 RepID=UPI00234308CD|nr:GGDEF domain-containing protein [Zeimonas sediminis]MCM5569314.1 GGDEF domain-containing protein [Zeimonas sediminis]